MILVNILTASAKAAGHLHQNDGIRQQKKSTAFRPPGIRKHTPQKARFAQPLQIGDRISIADAAGYTMVKKNWFNGVAMPAIAIRDEDGTIRTTRQFSYDDYKSSLS